MSEKIQAADGTPSSIGRYQITGTLGFGAMGAVYRAFDPIIKRTLAIKTIRLDVPRHSPRHRAFIERFFQEARISGTLSHPNIVTLFDVGDENGVPFLAMEYVDGQTMAALIESGTRFKPEKVIGLVSQVAAALDHAHSRGIIHRDVKPSNLIVQEGDKVKITDFGIAKLIDSEITQSGTLLGTPSYMSPEQAMGEKLDGRSDIFSLGVVAFEMMSGQQPFPGTNVTSILYKLVHVDPVEPADLEMNGLVPQKWREVFHRVLAKKPDNRYQTAGQFVRDLEYCLGSWFTGLGEETVALEAQVPAEATLTVPRMPAAPTAPGPEAREGGPTVGAEETVVVRSAGEAMAAGPDDSATVRLDAPRTSPGAEEQTVVLGSVEATDEVSGPTAAVEAPAEGSLTQPLPAPPPLPAPKTRPAPRAGGPRLPGVGWLLAAAAGLFLLAAGTVGWLLWQRGTTPTESVPSPTPIEVSVPDIPPPPPPTGVLRVVSDPPGARVTIDGKTRGETPLDLAEMPFGAYEVGLELKGYEAQSQEVSLSAERPTADVQVSLARRAPTRGTADFASTPAGATVKVNGRRVGKTPLAGVTLGVGRHRVEMDLSGHEAWSGTVSVEGGRRAQVEATLRPVRPVVAPTPTPRPVDTAKVYENTPGSVDSVARRTSGLSPSYPSDRAPRLRSGERVSVTLSFLVTETGTVEDVQVVDSAGKLIDDVVVAAVEGWKYTPATIRGTPVRVRILFKQTFLGG